MFGKLDKRKFKYITKDITTELVILTEKQIEHIRNRHPTDYEKYFKYFTNIILNPEYIIKDSKPNTAILLKRCNKEYFVLILRIHTSTDNIKYKNSIITFFKTNNKKYNQYIRTKEIVWKSIDS